MSRSDALRPAVDPVAEMDGWLTEAKGCGVPALANFAAGLESDGAAIRAALIDPGSSGQVEGQINRLGRAGLDLLRRRMIRARLIHAKCGRTTKAGQPHSSRLGSSPLVRPLS